MIIFSKASELPHPKDTQAILYKVDNVLCSSQLLEKF